MQRTTYRLGDIATFVNGYPFKPSDWRKDENGLKIVRIQNLTKDNAVFNYTTLKVPDKYYIKNGDVLVSWSATLDVFIWNGGDAILNQHIFKVVFDKVEIDKNYFVYLIKSKLDEMKSNVHGSTMTHITKERFDNIKIALPDIDEQRKVAAELDLANKPISLCNKEIELLDELVNSKYHEIFDNSTTYRLDELISSYTAKRCGNDNYEVLSITMHNGLVKQKDRFKKEVASKDKSNYKVVPYNKLVVAFPIDEGLLSVQNIVDNGIVSPAYSIYSINEQVVVPRVLEYILRSDNSIEYYKSHLRSTTLRRRMIPKTDFDSMPIKLPSIQDQFIFEKFILSVEKQKLMIAKKINLIQDLISKKIDEYFN